MELMDFTRAHKKFQRGYGGRLALCSTLASAAGPFPRMTGAGVALAFRRWGVPRHCLVRVLGAINTASPSTGAGSGDAMLCATSCSSVMLTEMLRSANMPRCLP